MYNWERREDCNYFELKDTALIKVSNKEMEEAQ